MRRIVCLLRGHIDHQTSSNFSAGIGPSRSWNTYVCERCGRQRTAIFR